MAVMSVMDVADVTGGRYTGLMPTPHHPDQVSLTEAMNILGVRTKPAFYRVLDRILRETGIDLRNRPTRWSTRGYYLRGEMEAAKRGDIDAIWRARGIEPPQGTD